MGSGRSATSTPRTWLVIGWILIFANGPLFFVARRFLELPGTWEGPVLRPVIVVAIGTGLGLVLLDGDNLRFGLNRDLGFSAEDRKENIRRVGCVGQLFQDAGVVALSAFISPYRADREAARTLAGEGRFVEVFVDTPLEVCEARDPKGLYKKARAGEIGNFTGISAPYEAPEAPEVHLRTEGRSVDDCAAEVVAYLQDHGFLGSR